MIKLFRRFRRWFACGLLALGAGLLLSDGGQVPQPALAPQSSQRVVVLGEAGAVLGEFTVINHGGGDGHDRVAQTLRRLEQVADAETNLQRVDLAWRWAQRGQSVEAVMAHTGGPRGRRGAVALAELWWGKPLRDLTMGQAAGLAAYILSPEAHSPVLQPEAWAAARETLLTLWADTAPLTTTDDPSLCRGAVCVLTHQWPTATTIQSTVSPLAAGRTTRKALSHIVIDTHTGAVRAVRDSDQLWRKVPDQRSWAMTLHLLSTDSGLGPFSETVPHPTRPTQTVQTALWQGSAPVLRRVTAWLGRGRLREGLRRLGALTQPPTAAAQGTDTPPAPTTLWHTAQLLTQVVSGGAVRTLHLGAYDGHARGTVLPHAVRRGSRVTSPLAANRTLHQWWQHDPATGWWTLDQPWGDHQRLQAKHHPEKAELTVWLSEHKPKTVPKKFPNIDNNESPVPACENNEKQTTAPQCPRWPTVPAPHPTVAQLQKPVSHGHPAKPHRQTRLIDETVSAQSFVLERSPRRRVKRATFTSQLEVDWFMDGEALGHGQTVKWALTPGQHLLTARIGEQYDHFRFDVVVDGG